MKRFLSAIAILIFSSVFLFAQGVEEIQSDETVVKVTGVTVDSQGVAVAANQLYGLLQKCLRVVEEVSAPATFHQNPVDSGRSQQRFIADSGDDVRQGSWY